PSNACVAKVLGFVVTLFALAACAEAVPSTPDQTHPIDSAPHADASEIAVRPLALAATVALAPLPVPRSPYAYAADDDPSDDLVVAPPAPRPTCADDLAKAGIRYKTTALAVHTEGKKKSKITCGAPDVVIYYGGPEKIAYSSPPLVTCTLALALARYETAIEEEAMRTFGKRVKKIAHLGTYSCREMANYPGWVSEHSYANAIDLSVFTLEDGKAISVLKDFQMTTETTTTNAAFLRAISHRAYDDDLFSNVLTRYFDKLHASHFHLDLGRYRTDGTRPE
ncbi:MAG: extensin family protein, partial [Polyangiaceae bacterium]